MDCSSCGRPVTVEHLETKPDPVHCQPCSEHHAGRCHPRCTACQIIAMVGYNMGTVRRCTSDEMLMIMWHFEKGAVAWRTEDGGHVVVVSPRPEAETFGLRVDPKGWCKRR